MTLFRRLGLFLEVIGLRAPRARVVREAQMARFRLRHAAFRRLLEANDGFLRGIYVFRAESLEEMVIDITFQT